VNTALSRVTAEFVGTALLLSTIVGSGIMGERLSGGNTASTLLANSLATGAGLYALISTFAGISGAHFNPLVTLSEAWLGRMSWSLAWPYVLAQCIGGTAGVVATHFMFELPLYSASHHARTGMSQWFSESLAAFGLLTVIFCCSRHRPAAVPAAVGAYITAGYWFTSSTSFANPAVTIARSMTDTFTGIRPVDAPGFIIAQIAGCILAVFFFRKILGDQSVS